jgi:hypothetical protein
MTRTLPALLLALLLVPAAARAQASASDVFDDYSSTELRGRLPQAEAPADEPAPSGKRSLLDVWNEEHKWVRVGMRFYGFNPTVGESQAFKLGAGVSVPVTTDFFMGLGMKIGFTGTYNSGIGCIRRAEPTSSELACDSGGTRGGVDIAYAQPVRPDGSTDNAGSDPTSSPSATETYVGRREAHAAKFALTIGGNYELTIPTVPFFRVFQPFVGGGVMIAWVYTWPDLQIEDFVLLNNEENDALDSNNVDPWSNQGPEVGGEIYGGFHVNLGPTFRLTVELGYHNVPVKEAFLNKATDGYDARHLAYTLSEFRFGGGFEFRF